MAPDPLNPSSHIPPRTSEKPIKATLAETLPRTPVNGLRTRALETLDGLLKDHAVAVFMPYDTPERSGLVQHFPGLIYRHGWRFVTVTHGSSDPHVTMATCLALLISSSKLVITACLPICLPIDPTWTDQADTPADANHAQRKGPAQHDLG